MPAPLAPPPSFAHTPVVHFVKLISALWLAWLLYWAIASLGVKRAAWRSPWWVELSHRLPLGAAAALLFLPHLPPPLHRHLIAPGPTTSALGVLLVALGLGFAVWARVHLAGNWSARVTVKQGHALVTTGPYRLVRHPIYTGILSAFLGTALGQGELGGLLALLLAFGALLLKSRIEEARMRATFADYAHYAQRTAALVPFLF
jgi:protein-S-isoprenylcysteine O-methyltransferase Ste14